MDENLEVHRRIVAALKNTGREKELLSRTPEPDELFETTQGDEGSKTADEKPVAPPTRINLFQHPDAHPYVLDLALLSKYGPQWLGWEAETLEWTIPQDFKTTGLSDLNMSKIQAVKTLHTVNSFWVDWEVFNWVTHALNGVFPDFEMMQVPTVAQCLVSADIANKIRTDVRWSEEVKGFIEQVYRFDDMFYPLPPLDFVNIDTEGLVVDVAEIAARWPEVRRSNKTPTGETVTDEQLRRCLVATNYLEEHRTTLRNQLPMVSDA